MSLEGHLDIVLARDPDTPARIELKEPVEITRLLNGRPPEAAKQLVPTLYSLCGTAHAAAAAQAIETAQGMQIDTVTQSLRTCLVLMERAREHLLRISLKWPELTGDDPDTKTAQSAFKLLPTFRQNLDPTAQAFSSTICNWKNRPDAHVVVENLISLAEDCMFGEEITKWLARPDRKEMENWAGKCDSCAARLIDTLLKCRDYRTANCKQLFLSESSLSNPLDAAGDIPETTVFDRRRSHPALMQSKNPAIADRYLARLIDLAETALELRLCLSGNKIEGLRLDQPSAAGVGQVETARGRLTHVVDLHDDLVADYKIISPTRWNFASRGVAARYLDAIPAGPDSERIQLADLVVGAIDPCVAYEVRIH